VGKQASSEWVEMELKSVNWDLVTTKTVAYGEPDDDCNDNDDGQDNKLNFHALKPHLAPELLPLPLENISLPNQQPSPSLHETTKRLHGQKILARTQHDTRTTPSKSEQEKGGGFKRSLCMAVKVPDS
jgi:hypothetical protein